MIKRGRKIRVRFGRGNTRTRRSSADSRIYSSKYYKSWRKKVFKRDLWQCQLCGKREYIQAHHIYPKSKFPKLIFVIPNGITLCGPATDKKTCHGKVTGKELDFAKILSEFTKTKDQAWLEIARHVLKIKQNVK